MYTIRENNQNLLEVKKSQFISFIYKINNLEEVNTILAGLKKEYSDSSHICYAYIIGNIKKSSDDGEPGGTAGIPILQVLEKQELNFCLCAVVRYFGGIKLGAGGLVRAYTKAVSTLLQNTSLVLLVPGYKIEIIIPYEEQKRLDYILRDYHYEKEYQTEVTYQIHLPKEQLPIIGEYSYKIIEEILLEEIIKRT